WSLKRIIDDADTWKRNDRARFSGPVGLSVQIVECPERAQKGYPLIPQQEKNRQRQQNAGVLQLPDSSRKVNQRRKRCQIKNLVRHRVDVTAQPRGYFQAAGEIAVKKICQSGEEHCCECYDEPRFRQRMSSGNADGQE